MRNLLKQIFPRIGLLIFGVFVAILMIEIGFRILFFSMPYSLQVTTSGSRQWGITGPPLGTLLNSVNYYKNCVGDEHLFARLLPGLDEVQIRAGPENIYHITSASLGFDDIGFRTSESSGPWDGIVLGDSFGFCMGVELEDCWVQKLEEKIDMRLANLSVPATGAVSHLRYLAEYGLALKPEVIIWQYWINDPSDDYSHIILGKQGCQRVVEADVAPDQQKTLQSLRDWLSQTLVTYNLVMAPALRTLLPQLAGPDSGPPNTERVTTTHGKSFLAYTNLPLSEDQITKVGMELTQDAILAASQMAADNGRLFLLVLAPDSLQVYRDFLPDSERLWDQARSSDVTTEQMITFAENHGIQYVDLRSELRTVASQKEVLPLYLEYDVHWSPSGNTHVAKILNDWFKEQSLTQ